MPPLSKERKIPPAPLVKGGTTSAVGGFYFFPSPNYGEAPDRESRQEFWGEALNSRSLER